MKTGPGSIKCIIALSAWAKCNGITFSYKTPDTINRRVITLYLKIYAAPWQHRFFYFSLSLNSDMDFISQPSRLLVFALCVFLAIGCADKKNDREGVPLFTLLTTDETGVSFSNQLTEGLNTNILMYEYFYNGAGVA